MKKTVLEACDIVKSFGGNKVLDGVSFQLNEGEIVLLQGANGSGKTTLINILTGNLAPDSGEVKISGKNSCAFRFPQPWYRKNLPFSCFSPESIARMGIGRVWQDVRIFAAQTAVDNTAMAAEKQLGELPLAAIFTPWLSCRAEQKNRQDAKKMLALFGLTDSAETPAGKLSFGESKRIAIARALYGGAKILFLDEPLAGLDRQEREKTVAMLKNLSVKHGITMVIVEHDLNIPLIREIATCFWELADGKLRSVMQSETSAIQRTDLFTWLNDCGKCIDIPLDNGVLKIVRRRGNSAESVLNLHNITVKRDERPVISTPLDMELHQGDIAVLSAPNGWGKSTLLEVLCGLLPLSSGTVLLKGRDISSLPVWERRAAGLHLSRTHNTLFNRLTVEENVRLNGINSAIMPDKAKRKAGSLSGGETRRLILECAFNSPFGEVLLLDEPFQALDSSTADWLRKCIENSADKTFLITVPGTTN